MLILLLISVTLIYGFYLWTVAKKYSHLPCDLGSEFPIIGNLYYSLRNSFMSYNDLMALLGRLWPGGNGIRVIWMYFRPVVAVSDPSIVEKLCKDPAFSDKEPLVYENISNLMKGSFSHARSHSTWRQQRKILNHSLKEQNLSAYHNIFVKTSKRMVDKIQYETGVFDVGIQAKMASLDSIFGTHLGCETNMMENKITRYTVKWGGIPISKTLINPFFGFFFNILIPIFPILRPTEKIIKECVKDAMKDNQQTDIDDLIEKRYLKAVLQQYVSVDESFNEIKKELMETLIVGSHSVGLSVGTTLVFLAALPEIQEKVWQEQQDIFGDSDRDPTITDVKRMEYLERVVKEVYRFISPPYMARKTRADINIDGTIIPTNTTVIVCSYLMRTDNQFWENPLKFDPDRYLRKEPMVDYKYSFSNFGYGIRNCPGYHYANNQVKVMLSTILRRFQVVTTGRRFEDIKLTARILMEIPEGYYISIKKRETLKK